jgi:hypothetical protein
MFLFCCKEGVVMDFTKRLSVQSPARHATTDLAIEAIGGTTLVQSFDLLGLQHDAISNFILVATGGPLTEISLLSTSGIKESKHFEVSGTGTAVPEPSTWAMLLIGFAGLGFAGHRIRTQRLEAGIAWRP